MKEDVIGMIFNRGRKFSPAQMFRMKKARKYLFLTLGSVFFFACAYYIVQKLPGTIKDGHGGLGDDNKNIGVNKKNRIPNKKEIKKAISLYEDNAMYDATLNVPKGELSFASCLLFSLVTQTTVGFAWFVPTDQRTRIVVFLQLLSVVFITTTTIL